MHNFYKYLLPSLTIAIGVIVFSCNPNAENKTQKIVSTDTLLYLNHSDSAKYVGINTCKLCHQDIYNTFIKTGMGKSFDLASKEKSSADYHTSIVHDKIGNFYYKAFYCKKSISLLEF